MQNVTDVDDPLLERATATGVDWAELAESQIQLFREDMDALNVLPPRALHRCGGVGPADRGSDRGPPGPPGGVRGRRPDFADLYFAQASDPEFGSLSHLTDDEAAAVFAERGGDPDRAGKKGAAGLPGLAPAAATASPAGTRRSVAAVRAGTSSAPRSPWTCSGTNFDVQAGGSDLVFPHHEMCASEARVATDEPFAQAYLHSGMVGLEGEKMSKSRGNLVFVSRLRHAGVDPMAIRLALLAHHYRGRLGVDRRAARRGRGAARRWREAVRLDAALNGDEVLAQMRAALAHDLDAPTALAAVDAWAGASTAIDCDDAEAPAWSPAPATRCSASASDLSRPAAGASPEGVVHRLDVVAVGVADESAEVARVVLRPTRGACRLSSPGQGGLVEGGHRLSARGAEGEVALPVGDRVGRRTDPEHRVLGAVAHRGPDIHQDAVTKRFEHSVVEAAGGGEVVHLDAEVIDHVPIVSHRRHDGNRVTTRTATVPQLSRRVVKTRACSGVGANPNRR